MLCSNIGIIPLRVAVSKHSPPDSADNIALTLRRRKNSGIRQSLVNKLLHSLDRSDREQARTAGAVLVMTIPSNTGIIRELLDRIAKLFGVIAPSVDTEVRNILSRSTASTRQVQQLGSESQAQARQQIPTQPRS